MAKIVIYARVSTQGQDHFRAISGKVGRKEGYRKSEEAMRLEAWKHCLKSKRVNILAS